jgi:hypothetical protein
MDSARLKEIFKELPHVTKVWVNEAGEYWLVKQPNTRMVTITRAATPEPAEIPAEATVKAAEEPPTETPAEAQAETTTEAPAEKGNNNKKPNKK